MAIVNRLNLKGCSSDESLLLAAGRGDSRAFAEVVRRHQQWAWRIAHRFCGDGQEAADIVQEAFLRILAASGRYRSTARFRTYFHRVITHLCMDRARKKHPCFMETVPESPEGGTCAVETMVQEETALMVRRALDSLTPGQRMAVVLRYYEELPYKEIARALDTTPKAVEGLLARARQHLKSALGDNNDIGLVR